MRRSISLHLTGLVTLCILLQAAGCTLFRPPAPLTRIPVAQYPLFGDDLDFAGLSTAAAKSLDYYKRLPPDRLIRFGADTYGIDHLIDSLDAFTALISGRPDADTLNRAIREDYLIYRARGTGGDGRVLFTGYYEPVLAGSPLPGPGYPVPVLSRPGDLVEIDLSPFGPDLQGRRIAGRYTDGTVIPYPDRGQIRRQGDRIATLAPPIAWLRDEVDLLILQIQGSGRIAFEDGRTLAVRYDGSNGRPYQSIGRVLIDQGRLDADAVSMQSIRDYLRRNPGEREAIIDANPRYIFFKAAKGGPFGSLNQPLTPLRSIAIDPLVCPAGALAFIQVPLPDLDDRSRIVSWKVHHGFALAQDSGSAIKGAGRVDLFWGGGAGAEIAAGHLKHSGELYFIVLKKRPPP